MPAPEDELMATKNSKPNSKSTKQSASKDTGQKKKSTSSVTKPKASTRKTSPTRTTNSSRSKSQPEKKPSGSTAKSSQQKQKSDSQDRDQAIITLNRRLDITGIVIIFIGALVLLSLLSSQNSQVTGGLLSFFRWLVGGGIYILPFVLIGAGLWLVLRNFDRVPNFNLERAAGIVFLFFNILAWLHWIRLAIIEPGANIFDTAKAGQGGGYLGALPYAGLEKILGIGGTFIALIAWLLISLTMVLDISMVDLARWVSARINDLRQKFSKSKGKSGSAETAYQQGPPYPELTPLPPGHSELDYVPGALQPFVSADPSTNSPFIPSWVLPPMEDILEAGVPAIRNDEDDQKRGQLIEETLASFGAPARVVDINRGPTITQFGVEPDFIETRNGRTRVRVAKIASLANDLALALSARTIRVEAPVPGKGFVGIEVPNDEIATVALRDVIENEAFKRLKSPIRFALGQNVSGNAVAADLAGMPHLLIAGQTGSGKSVCVNALISCLLLNNTPNDLRLIMVDPKRVELTGYNGIPHLLAPVVVELERVVSVLQWVTREMDMRYRKLAEAGSRNIQDYNSKMTARGQPRLPFLVIIVDELADLMMLAPDETERSLTRLAQLARATGIHLVIATQRPSVDVVTGLIKANFPARIAFAVASNVDSRVILDQPGAETLLGRGDMLYQAPDSPAPVRLQGVYVSDSEILNLVAYWQQFSGLIQPAPTAIEANIETLPSGVPLKQMTFWDSGAPEPEGDPLMAEAIDLARRQGRASISMLQRRLRIGYTRAARLIETMEEKGIIGPPEPGSGAREILDYGPTAPPADDR